MENIILISARRFQIFHFKFQHISTQILAAAFVRGNISIPEKRFWAQAQKQRLVEQVETWTLNLNPQGPQGCCWNYVVFRKQKTKRKPGSVPLYPRNPLHFYSLSKFSHEMPLSGMHTLSGHLSGETCRMRLVSRDCSGQAATSLQQLTKAG